MHGLSECGAAGHRALIYDHPDRFVDAVAAFALEGVRDGDRVLVATAPAKFRGLRDAIGDDADAITFVDAGALYEHHGPMFTTALDYLVQQAAPGRGRARIVAEQALSDRSAVEVRAYLRWEAAANVIYDRFAASLLCPYDGRVLPEAVIRDATRTHPQLLDDGGSRPNAAFLDPRAFVRGQLDVQAPPAGAPAVALEQLASVAHARRRVAEIAATAGLPRPKIEELLVAVSEVATNAVVHGRAPGWLWIYRRDDALICHVADHGIGLPDPLIGYISPDLDATTGRGLWLAHQLCDNVETAGDASGTHVYLQMVF